MAFSPVNASKKITNEYRRYLSTVFSIGDAEYQKLFEAQLKTMPFAKGPYLEVTDAFITGESPRQLIAQGEFPKGFKNLRFPLDRALYQHQIDSLRHVSSGKNAVISTGTGSGKTESFLLPVLNELIREDEAGTLCPGVRAMLIYPMNALANDQVERLRDLLADYPEITFGCYTGQTEEYYDNALNTYLSLNDNRNPPKNELISREQMKATPPSILITNYAMLEYLMVRPDDSVFFKKKEAQYWKFIVLDEAHVYRGSTGIEVAMLLRRLQARLDNQNIQYILTSATLGGEEENTEVASFAQNLCNCKFTAEDIIRAKRIKLELPEQYTVPDEAFYHTIAEQIQKDAASDVILSEIKKFYPNAANEEMEALFEILYRDPFYWRIRKALSKPKTVNELLKELDVNEQQLTDFVTVATRAVHEHGKLFDARYHMFLRAAESVFITLGNDKALFLEARKSAIVNGKTRKVFEIATCNNCHAIYILGKEINGILEQQAAALEDEPRCAYLLSNSFHDSDDEHTLEDAGEETEVFELCPVCGSIIRFGTKHDCEHTEPFITVIKVKLKEDTQRLTKCACCENISPTGILRQFFVGQEAVTSVIGTSLFNTLPSYTIEQLTSTTSNDDGFDDEWGDSSAEAVHNDVGAKQFIAFSDSRQAAAFYATYLDQTYTNIVYKRLVVETLKKREYDDEGKTMDDFVEDVMAQFEKYSMASQSQLRKEAWKAVLHEAEDINGITSLYNFGLIEFDIPAGIARPNNKYALSTEEVREICALFSDWMMSEGAINYPETMNVDERSFYAHNGIEHNYTLSDADPRKFTLSFIPSKEGFINKRIDFLSKVLSKKGTCFNENSAQELITGIWNRFFIGEKGLMSNIEGKYRLSSNQIIVKRPKTLYRCGKCHKITTHNIAGICPGYRCDGQLKPFIPEEEFAEFHYWELYNNMEIRPLRVVEHTAQLNRETAYEYQNEFKKKNIDILSCSTTFEMGVDVGSLETVFMRNVPPSPANYAQRAGRAGRSLYSAAYALTFCNKSNHDFTFFKNPEKMIKGRIAPPVFDVANKKIAIRHVYASAFSQFWRLNPSLFSTVSKFMDEDDTGINGLKLFKDYILKKPAVLKEYLKEFLPERLAKELNVDEFGWVDLLLNDEEGLLTLAEAEYNQEMSDLMEARERAYLEHNYGVDRITQRMRVFKEEKIISYLARHNIFPKYGFPVDTVELLIDDKSNNMKSGLELSRDLSMAISEYAPGSQVIANGKLITSRYIRKMPDRSWKMARYCKCKICGDLNLSFYDPSVHFSPGACRNCGTDLEIRQAGVYLIPEFGFEADTGSIKKPGLKKPVRTYKSEVSYIGANDESCETEYNIKGFQIFVRPGRNEEMAVLNRSRFYVCELCGFTDLDEKKFTDTKNLPHKTPTGYFCKNKRLKHYSLAYRFSTDILSMRFQNPQITTEDQALSILYGLLEGASRVLNVERNDIAGVLHWFYNRETYSPNYSFVFYDKTPGGAGHVRRLNDPEVLEILLKDTLDYIGNCTCGEDTSCYSCLRNYYNQKYHDRLQRRYVTSFLKGMPET